MSKFRQVLTPDSGHITKPTPPPELPKLQLDQDKPLSIPNSVCILFLGAIGAGKKCLARSILTQKWPIVLNIRTSTILPLPESDRPRIDFIVFFVDMTNYNSFEQLRKNLTLIGKEYFALGRACVVANRVDLTQSYAFTADQLESIAEIYELNVFYCNFTDPKLVKDLAYRIYKSAEIANRHNPYVNSLMVRTLDTALVTVTGDTAS